MQPMKGWAAEQRCGGVACGGNAKRNPLWFGRFVDTDAMACAELGGSVVDMYVGMAPSKRSIKLN